MGGTLEAENPLWKQLRVSSSRLMFMLAYPHLDMNGRTDDGCRSIPRSLPSIARSISEILVVLLLDSMIVTSYFPFTQVYTMGLNRIYLSIGRLSIPF